MILAIDAGNSTVGFGFFEGRDLVLSLKAESRPGATPDEYSAFLRSHMRQANIAPEAVGGAVISSVVPPLVHVFFEALKGMTDASPLVVSGRLKLGIKIKYRTPETLGPDRIAAAHAAFEKYGGPVAVVDFGTATTISVVDKGGSFLGGMIAPGLMTGFVALTGRAAALKSFGLTYPRSAIGADTEECVQSGVILGHAAMVDGMLGRVDSELGADAAVVATGGLAGLALPHMARKTSVEPHLVLQGLASIFVLNTSY